MGEWGSIVGEGHTSMAIYLSFLLWPYKKAIAISDALGDAQNSRWAIYAAEAREETRANTHRIVTKLRPLP